MNAADEFRLRQVQLVIAAVDEDPLGVQQRAHGAVAQQRPALHSLKKNRRHLFTGYRMHPQGAPTLCYNRGFDS